MNEVMKMALNMWERWGYGPGYWDGYIEGLVAADPSLEKDRIVWECLTCHKTMTGVAFHTAHGKPACPRCTFCLVIYKDPRKESLRHFEGENDIGAIKER